LITPTPERTDEMYEIAPSITVDASPQTVWEYVRDVEAWWVASNPEHESLEILSADGTLEEGTSLRVRERIAGVPGVATGEVTEVVPQRRLTWEATDARYRYFGLTVHVDESVSWELTPIDGATELTARVRASFPETLVGSLVEWSFEHLLDGVERDYQHAMRELEYIREELESSGRA